MREDFLSLIRHACTYSDPQRLIVDDIMLACLTALLQ